MDLGRTSHRVMTMEFVDGERAGCRSMQQSHVCGLMWLSFERALLSAAPLLALLAAVLPLVCMCCDPQRPPTSDRTLQPHPCLQA